MMDVLPGTTSTIKQSTAAYFSWPVQRARSAASTAPRTRAALTESPASRPAGAPAKQYGVKPWQCAQTDWPPAVAP